MSNLYCSVNRWDFEFNLSFLAFSTPQSHWAIFRKLGHYRKKCINNDFFAKFEASLITIIKKLHLRKASKFFDAAFFPWFWEHKQLN